MGRITPFDGGLSRVTLADTLKVTAGEGPAEGRGRFKRTEAGAGLGEMERMLPRGPSFFHDAFRLQLLENILFLARPERDIPFWTGDVRFEYHPGSREVQLSGNVVCAIPDEQARERLADHCRAVAQMLLAYAQLPGTPAFSIALEYHGEWVGAS